MKFDVIIIGGGILGLSTAHQLLNQNPNLKVAILEKEARLAAHQTGRNSGVIHSGIYYKPGSLKAKNCILGRELLIKFADQHQIPYELCGKLIAATNPSELPRLEDLYIRGQQNGLAGLKKLSATEILDYEPEAKGLAGIFVPQTGIIDYKLVAKKLGELFIEQGGKIYLNSEVKKILQQNNQKHVTTTEQTFSAKLIVNCAGLYADVIAKMGGAKLEVKIIPFRGEYYKIKPDKKHLVKNLIYPVPDPNFPFLGVHFTRHIDGELSAGPNAVLAFRREGYKKTNIHLKELAESLSWRGFHKVALKYWKTGFGEFYRSYSKTAFTAALQKLVPNISEKDLLPAQSGVRAQACSKDGKLLDDFCIVENQQQINILNAPSPAATSCLSIGQTIAEMALKHI